MKKTNARRLKHDQLTELRRRGVAAVQAGESPEDVIRVLGISRATMYGWLALYRHGGWGQLDARKRGASLALNLISAVSRQGHFRFMGVQGRVKAKVFIGFLKRLLVKAKRMIFLIVDGHPTHKAKVVQKFVARESKRLRLYFLPPYSPELNPDEYVKPFLHPGIGYLSFDFSSQGLGAPGRINIVPSGRLLTDVTSLHFGHCSSIIPAFFAVIESTLNSCLLHQLQKIVRTIPVLRGRLPNARHQRRRIAPSAACRC